MAFFSLRDRDTGGCLSCTIGEMSVEAITTTRILIRPGTSQAITGIGPDKGLTLFNTVRLDEKGEAQLLELGPIKRVVRLSSMHGMDDPYYVHKFGTEVWGMPGMTWDEYCKKCDPVTMTHNLLEASLFPEEAEVVTLENITVPECMLFFRGKGLLLACDFIMQCENPRHEKISDVNFGRLSHFVGRLIGFKGEAVTPSVYVKNFTKDKNFACIKATSDKIQELPYTTIISGHGPPMIGDAKARRQGFIDACK
ncbi:unnamed protein product [Discosporangium mesarthrocarpum]